LRYFWGAALIFLLVMGGIYGGIFTPSEAAALGCSGAFILSILKRRLNKSMIIQTILSSVRTTSMIFLIFIGGTVFNVFVALSGMAREIAAFFGALPLPPIVILSFILFTYIPLGCLMDSLALLVLTTPIYLPIFNLFGFDLIWIGVLMVVLIEIGLITPPMGLNLFVIKDVAASSKQVSLGEIYKGVVPFILIDLVALAFLMFFPQISLFLPSLMR
jgi:C4-dicarboxylate transporter DctM subunit